MNLIKTTLRNRLTNDSLNSIWRLRISRISLESFHYEHLENCVDYWFDANHCHLGQQNRKPYVKRESKKAKRLHFNISDISSDSGSSNSSESENEIVICSCLLLLLWRQVCPKRYDLRLFQSLEATNIILLFKRNAKIVTWYFLKKFS